MDKTPIQHCSVIRFVSQCKPNGKMSYGYHHQQCESQSYCEMHPPNAQMSLEDAAKSIRQLNGYKAIEQGFISFYTWTQSYGAMTTKGQPYLGRTENVKIVVT